MEVLTPRLHSIVMLLVALAACGEPLATTEDFRGRPLLSVRGEVAWLGLTVASGAPIRVALFWSQGGTQTEKNGQLDEDRQSQFRLEFPTAFELNTFAPPKDWQWVGPGPHGLGLILAYLDNDENGRFNESRDMWVGYSNTVVIYAPEAVAQESSPVGAPLDEGWHTFTTPLACDLVRTPPPANGKSCHPLLGAPCKKNEDCGVKGICLTKYNRGGQWPLTGGYCAWNADVLSCAPELGRRVPLDERLWLQPCSQGTCNRKGYTCTDLCPSKASKHPWVCLPDGLTISGHDLDCDQPLWSPDHHRTPCPSSTGQPCDKDSDCTNVVGPYWRCMKQLDGIQLTGGYCTVDDPYRHACNASTDVLIYRRRRVWFAACREDSRCRRAEGYTCDPYYLACVPTIPNMLQLKDLQLPGPEYSPLLPPLCMEASP